MLSNVLSGSEQESTNPEKCVEKCSSLGHTFAAIVANRKCLCSRLEEGMALDYEKFHSEKECNSGSEEYFRAYKSKVFHHANNTLKFRASPTIGTIDEPVVFEITANVSSDVQFMMDYGDETCFTDWVGPGKLTHVFHGSGLHKVKLFGRLASEPELKVMVHTMIMKIVDKVAPKDFAFECMPLIEPGDDPFCNVTSLAGQDINVVVDFNDSSAAIPVEMPGKIPTII